MGQDPDAIRQEIEQTRAEMSETVEAIGYKADVPSRAKDAMGDKVDSVRSKVSEAASRAKEAVAGTASRADDAGGGVTSRVANVTPSGGDVKRTTRRAVGLAQENPLGLAIGAVAVGFLAGLAVPASRVEDERLGPVADQAKEKIKETGQEAFERGKQVAQEAASSAAETAKQRGQQHGQDLAASARRSAEEVRDQASERISNS
jgi:gas vesicle protein